MTFAELRKEAEIYSHTLFIEAYFPRRMRKILFDLFFLLTLGCIISLGIHTGSPEWVLPAFYFSLSGLFITGMVGIISYVRHYLVSSLSLEVAEIISQTSDSDITASLVQSKLGQEFLKNLEVSPIAVKHFFRVRARPLDAKKLKDIPKEEGKIISFADYARAIWDSDRELRNFFASHGVKEKKFLETLSGMEKGNSQKIEVLDACDDGFVKMFQKKIGGQSAAAKIISKVLLKIKPHLTVENRPKAMFLFFGPKGVGKSEAAKMIAAQHFGHESKLVSLDLRDFSTQNSALKLLGSCEEDTSGLLADFSEEDPQRVLLLEGFENAHQTVQELLSDIFLGRRLIGNDGREVNFRNNIIVITSSVGTDYLFNLHEAGRDVSGEEKRFTDMLVRETIFRPEFLELFHIVIFRPLEREDLDEAAFVLLRDLQARLNTKGINLTVTPELVLHVKAACSADVGARPINKKIEDLVEGVILRKMVDGELHSGSSVCLTEKDFA